MKWEIKSEQSFPVLKCTLDAGESMKAQSGAMLAMSANLKLQGKMEGGLGKAIGRLFSGESFFMQRIETDTKGGWVIFAPKRPGDMIAVEVKPYSEITVQKDGFIAGTDGIEVSSKVQSLTKGILSGEGFFVVQIGGTGTVFLETYGSILLLELAANEEVIVDNGHLVAWETAMNYTITKGGTGWVSSVTSGEGFVCKFKGPGKVWVQTRNPQQLADWINDYLPKPQVVQQ